MASASLTRTFYSNREVVFEVLDRSLSLLNESHEAIVTDIGSAQNPYTSILVCRASERDYILTLRKNLLWQSEQPDVVRFRKGAIVQLGIDGQRPAYAHVRSVVLIPFV